VVAKGDILDGTQAPGAIGGDSTAALIREARQDDDIKAIVLRIDSGGGSVFASEVIRREVELARADGKPVVASMGSVAASGGYWIATSADEIWATPETVTGSIGIFGLFPTFQKPLAKYLGIHVDGVGTTWLSGAVRPDRELAAGAAEALQRILNRGYEEFLERVGKARKMTRDQVDKIARGRIWSGEDAHRLGLVDQLGDLPQAIAAAARRAKLAGEPQVRFIERELDWNQKLATEVLDSAAVRLIRVPTVAHGFAPALRLRPVLRELEALARWNDPQGLYAHCFCSIDG
jgi:protease-4